MEAPHEIINTDKYYHEWVLQYSFDRSFEIPLLPSENDNLNFFPELPDYDQFWDSICTDFEQEWRLPVGVNNYEVIIPGADANFRSLLVGDNDETLNAVVEEGLRRSTVKEEETMSNDEDDIKIINKSKMNMLEYEEIRKHFEMPISMAAKALNVGLTVLKKRCRELNIKRWPHRKIKSMNTLISSVKEYGLTEVAEMLEEHTRKLKVLPEMELTSETKRLRQAIFKANYKKRRSSAPH